MYKNFTCLASIVLVFSLLAAVSNAQATYEFDGDFDGTSWDEATNWAITVNPDLTVGDGSDPATPPDAITNADIPLLGVVIDSTMPGQTALNVNVGTANGAGSLTLSGTGGLTASTDFNVGRDGSGTNGGTFDMTGGTLDALDDISLGAGSAGIMTMSDGAASAGDDFFINADSSLDMTGGTIIIGDRLVSDANASINVDGGTISADDDFFFFGATQVTVDSGLMEVKDKLRFDDVLTTGKLTINGGVVRTQEFGFVDDFDAYIMNGVAEINGDGVLQVELNDGSDPVSQLTLASAKALIAEGIHLTTSAPSPQKLGVSLVVVPDFFGGTDVTFVQISVVPEPSSVVLLSLGGLGLLLRRKRA